MRGRGFRFGNTPKNPMVLGVILLVVCVLGFVVYKMMYKTPAQIATSATQKAVTSASNATSAAQKAATSAANTTSAENALAAANALAATSAANALAAAKAASDATSAANALEAQKAANIAAQKAQDAAKALEAAKAVEAANALAAQKAASEAAQKAQDAAKALAVQKALDDAKTYEAEKAANIAARKAQDAKVALEAIKEATTSKNYILQKTNGLIYTGSSFTDVTKQFTTPYFLKKVFKLNNGTFGGVGRNGDIFITSPRQPLIEYATFTRQTSSADFEQAIQMKDGTFTALKGLDIYTAPTLAGPWTLQNRGYGSLQVFQLRNGDVGRIDSNDKSIHINKGHSTFTDTLNTEIIPNPGVQVKWVAIIPNTIYSVGIDNNIYSTPTLYGATWSPVTSTRDALYLS